MDLNAIEKSLGISDEKLIRHFFPFLLLKQLQHNFETGNFTNLSGTRDQVIINLLGSDSNPSDEITNFDLNSYRDLLAKLHLIKEEKDKNSEIQKKAGHLDPRGPKGKLYSVTEDGFKILEKNQQHLKEFIKNIINYPNNENANE